MPGLVIILPTPQMLMFMWEIGNYFHFEHVIEQFFRALNQSSSKKRKQQLFNYNYVIQFATFSWLRDLLFCFLDDD